MVVVWNCALPPLKALPVLDGRQEGLDHLGAAVVAFRGIELREPVVETGRVRVAPQITEVLHRDEGWIELPACELFIFNNPREHGAPWKAALPSCDQRVAIRRL